MSSGTGQLMISLKKSSPRRILLIHSERSSGCLGSHQNSVRSATNDETLALLPSS